MVSTEHDIRSAFPSPGTPPARQSQGLLRALRSPHAARLLFPLAVLGLWFLILELVDSRIMPTPAEVFGFMWDELTLDTLARRSVYVNFAISLARLAVGFAIAMVLGTVIGLAMGLWKAADAFFHDWVMAILAMPALAWALFTGLAFGFGNKGPILTAILAGIPFVIVNVREGVRNTPKELFDMARSFQVPQNRITRHVLVPSMMPFIFAAARYSFAIGWKGLVIAEVFGATNGAGWTIKYWYDAHRAQGVLGYALFFIIFALFLERVVFERLERRVFRWRPQIGGVEIVEERFERVAEGRPFETSVVFTEDTITGFARGGDTGPGVVTAAEETESDHEGDGRG